MKRWQLYSIALLVILFSSCSKEDFLFNRLSDDVTWNPDLAVPVAYGNLTMRDILPEREDTIVYFRDDDVDEYGSLIDAPTEQRIKLIYVVDSMLPFADYMKLPVVENYYDTINLHTLELDDFNVTAGNTFNDLLVNNFDTTDQKYYNNKILTGNPEDYIQHDATNTNVYTLFGHESIEWAFFSDGTITVRARNTFDVPVRFSYDLFTLYQNNRYSVATFDFTKDTITNNPIWINPGETVSRVVQLDNTLISSILEYELTSLSFGDATNASLVSADSLLFEFSGVDLKADSARAFLPKQLLDIDTTKYFTVREGNQNKQLFHIDVKSGKLSYSVETTVEYGAQLSVELPTVTRNNIPLQANLAFSGANTINGKQVYHGEFDLSGYTMDLTQSPDIYYNTLPARLKFSIGSEDSNPKDFIEFRSDDQIVIAFDNLDSLEFSYIGGFYDFDTVDIPVDSIDFAVDEFIKDYFEGEIVFTDPQINIQLDNGIGADGILDIGLTGYNADRDSVQLFDAGENSFPIYGPSDRNDVANIPYENIIKVDKETSNLVDFFSVLPNSLHYQGTLLLNTEKNGDIYTFVDTTGLSENPWDINFVTDQGQMGLKIEAALPLEFYMKNLTLRQDFPINAALKDVKEIDSLKLYFNTKNGFPLDINVNVIMLDTTLPETAQELGTLNMYIVEEAHADERGKVEPGVYKELEQTIEINRGEDDALIEGILQMNKIRVEVTLNTEDSQNNKPINIYTYYGVDFVMSLEAEFTYQFDLFGN